MNARDDEETATEGADRESAERVSLSDVDVETSPSEHPSSLLESEPAPPPTPGAGGWRTKGKGTGGGWRPKGRTPASPPRIAPAVRAAGAATTAKAPRPVPTPLRGMTPVSAAGARAAAEVPKAPSVPEGIDVDVDVDDTAPGVGAAPEESPQAAPMQAETTVIASFPSRDDDDAAQDAAAQDDAAQDAAAEDDAPEGNATDADAPADSPDAEAERGDERGDDDGEGDARTVTAAHMASLVSPAPPAPAFGEAAGASAAGKGSPAARRKPTTPPPPPAVALVPPTNPPPQVRDPEADALLAAPTNPPPPFEGDSERPIPGVPKAPRMPTESIVVDPEYRRESERPAPASLAAMAAGSSQPATPKAPSGPILEPPEEPLELTTVPPSEVPPARSRSRVPAMLVAGVLLVGAGVLIGGRLGDDTPPAPAATATATTAEDPAEAATAPGAADAPEPGNDATETATEPAEPEAPREPVTLTLRGVGPGDVVRIDGLRVAVSEAGEIDFPADPERHRLTVELPEGETWERTLSAESPLTLIVRDAPPPAVARPTMRVAPRTPPATTRTPRPRMVVRGPTPRTTGPIRRPGF